MAKNSGTTPYLHSTCSEITFLDVYILPGAMTGTGPVKLQPRIVRKIGFFKAKISDFLVRE
jgi:hypothetical protein